jgi:3-methyladenine DNA glycosylase/8-oxoguanine DNA glycosylase
VTAAARRTVACPGVDVASTLRPFGVFRSDPTHAWWPSGFARATLTTEGPGTVAFRWRPDGRVDVEAWGPGAAWLLDAAPRWLGCDDDPSSFRPAAGTRLAELWRRHGSFRLGRSGLIWHEMAVTILGQRVTGLDAMRSWRQLVETWGDPAPGPHGLRLPPAPSALAGRCYRELHPFGVERRRADALVLAARRADRLEEAATMPVDDALVRLSALSGLGAWTATSTAALSHGHPDVVIVGDYGIPTLVSYAFTGSSRRVDDERMLELLEPFAGHRWRVVRLLSVMGVSAPRRAPRARNPRIARL